MTLKRQVYLLDPTSLSPETIAVTFAKTSRSPESFREIAAELNDARSAQFHEKWVVGYGHSSVAEHAVLHIACENISRLAVECLQSNRLASYTEKSTRYQKWDAASFVIPPELEHHLLSDLYLKTCRQLFATYQQVLPAVQHTVSQHHPRQKGESDAAWERRIRTEYVDICRFLLPAASMANVGMTINARALEHALCKLLSHPLAEVRTLGEEIKAVAQAEVPTLVKYAHPLPHLDAARQAFAPAAAKEIAEDGGDDWCRLVHYDPEGEERVLAAALYRYGENSYAQALNSVKSMPAEQKSVLAQALFSNLDSHDIPLRELEYAAFTFDVILDQGAYYELKRHRMMTQTPQPLTADLGYAVPRLIVAAGMEQPYREAMEDARLTYRQIAAWNPEVAAYIVPNGFNRRVLLQFNLRSADHLLQLRTAPNAHFSIRRIAKRLAEEMRQVSPLFGSLLRAEPSETWRQIEDHYFAQLH